MEPKPTGEVMAEIRRDLTRTSSKIENWCAGLSKRTHDAKQMVALRKAEKLVDEARRVLYEAQR